MARSATTGVYTRVDNSFSNPVVGTTISPNDADSFFDDIESAMNSFIGTSSTSLAIGTGSTTFTTETGKTFIPGTFIQAVSRAAPTTNYMYGTITSYDSGTGSLVINVTVTGGSGTYADWSLFFSGARGATGATGPTGPGYTASSSSSNTIASSGSKSFTVASGLAYTAGARVRASDSANPTTNYMEGVVTSYSGTTLTFTADLSAGSGTITSWNINLAGNKGTDGAGTMGGTVGSTANVIPKANGTGGVTLQASGWLIDGTNNITPTTSDGGALGTTTLMVSDAFLASGAVVNFNNGNYTLTHSSGLLTASGPFSLGTSNALTAGSIELGNASDTTLARSGAGVLSIEGKIAATLSTSQSWTNQQYTAVQTLTDAASIAWDVDTRQKAKVTLGGNRTMSAVTNAVEGATYTLWVIQDGTGSRTITWTTSGAGSFDFGTDGAPTLTTTASRADVLCFEALSIGGTLKLRYLGIKKGYA